VTITVLEEFHFGVLIVGKPERGANGLDPAVLEIQAGAKILAGTFHVEANELNLSFFLVTLLFLLVTLFFFVVAFFLMTFFFMMAMGAWR
tara:strand:+ start:1330 stop:1599 length:270 start_codon:yes stop_codon:yes gene_type:complete